MNILKKLTNNYLKLNKKRTIVTIIGIILSGAMISAVATLAVTFQKFMLQTEIAYSGAWEVVLENVKAEDIKYVEQNTKFEETMLMAPYAMAQNTFSDEKFIYIEQYSKQALEKMGETLQKGRFPENSNEIVLSSSFFDGKEKEPQIGDRITLPLGKRISKEGLELKGSPEEEGETFVSTESKTFTICGIISRPRFERSEDCYTAGITLLDPDKIDPDSTVNIGVITKNPKNIYEDCEQIAEALGLYTISNVSQEKIYMLDYHTGVLMYKGISNDNGFMAMLYSVCGVLILVIMIGSILVIYNSFAISVSERKRQFGMLSSVGATKKQIKRSVIYEGMTLGLIGIPLGILSGIGGIWVTLKIVNHLLQPILNQSNWSLELVVSWPSIIVAALLIVVTIYMSVIIPAKRASRITPIEAIRQTDDIKEVKPNKVKTPKFIRRLFGIEGDLALKNLKRSKKRYRTTVISLIISIVLFITVSGFTGYLFKGFDSMYVTVDYDYAIGVRAENQEKSKQIAKEIEQLDGVERCSIIEQLYTTALIPEEKMDTRLIEAITDPKTGMTSYMDKQEDGTYLLPTQMISLNEAEQQRYGKEIGIKEWKNNEAVLINYTNSLYALQVETDVTKYKEKEDFPIQIFNKEKQSYEKNPITLVKVTDKMPFGIDNTTPSVLLVVTEQTLAQYREKEQTPSEGYTLTAKVNKDTLRQKTIDKEIETIQQKYPDATIMINNIAEMIQSQKNLKLVIQIFLYGFIALISAIGIANIFNTISTNIALRRREFANLKSVGMTDKSFKKMLDLECVFYGTKALLYGLPLGILLCYMINQGFGNLATFIFQLPWDAIIIAMIAVYAVVFITMLYASNKVKKENIIDVLRDDNV